MEKVWKIDMSRVYVLRTGLSTDYTWVMLDNMGIVLLDERRHFHLGVYISFSHGHRTRARSTFFLYM